MAERVSADALWDIKDYLGLPATGSCPMLHTKLAEAGGEKISRQLIEQIDTLATTESIGGSSLSGHEKTMSTFRFVRWRLDDNGLQDCVRLLASRSDDPARIACRRYLIELPWGADRQATLALIDGMSARPDADNQALFREAIAVHKQPAVLRTWLWAAIGENDPDQCRLGVIGDLGETVSDADHRPPRVTMAMLRAEATDIPVQACQPFTLSGRRHYATKGLQAYSDGWRSVTLSFRPRVENTVTLYCHL